MDFKELFACLLGKGLFGLSVLRQHSKVKHLIPDYVAIVLFCVFSDVNELADMESFAEDNSEILKNI